MIVVYGTPEFILSVRQLADKHKKHYGACRSDICTEFGGKGIEDLRLAKRPIRESPNFVAKKVRVQSSIGNTSKDAGYRVIVLVNKTQAELIFLFVFPKLGPKGEDNYTHEYFVSLIREALVLRSKGELIRLDLDNDLAEI